jgi:hypothetical protein
MSAGTPLANGLYPIIRRARRPFIIQDDDAGPAPAPPPVTVPPIEGEAGVSYPKSPPAQKRKQGRQGPEEQDA